MRKLWPIATLTILLMACAALPRYTAPFAEVDHNGDGVIAWQEFITHYPDSDAKAFLQADRQKNGEITPDEWQYFVETQTP